MRQFSFSGFRVRVDDEAGRFEFRIAPHHALLTSCFALIPSLMFLFIPVGVAVAELRGQVEGFSPQDGLPRVVSWGFLAFLHVLFGFFALAGVLCLRPVFGFFVFGGMAPYVLDRRVGLFRLGRRLVCELDKVAALGLLIEQDRETGEEYSRIYLRIKDVPDLPVPYLGRFGLKNQDVGRFLSELAGFLGVPIVKVTPATQRDPFVADCAEFFGECVEFLGFSAATSGRRKPPPRDPDFEAW